MDNQMSKAERTRNSITASTAGIFNVKGYAGTSMSDLVQATGLTKGSIYGNFENKNDVAVAAFHYNHQKVLSIVQQQMQQAVSYFEKLLVFTRVYDEYSKNGFPLGGCPILNTAVEADDTNPLLKSCAAKAVLSWKKNICDLITAGIHEGEFKRDIDQDQLAVSVIALIEGGIMISKVTGSQASMDQVMKTVKMLITQIKI